MEEISQSEIPFVPASLKSRYLQVSSSVLWVSSYRPMGPVRYKNYSAIAHIRTGSPVAPSMGRNAAMTTAPAGGTLSRLHITST